MKKKNLPLNSIIKIHTKMNVLKLTQIILFLLSLLVANPINTNDFLKPEANLTELKPNNKATFLGFQGKNKFYKTANVFTINANNEIIELPNFKFVLTEKDESYFFSGHVEDLTGNGKNNMVITVTSPTIGTKIYLWEINEKKEFIRLQEPYIIKNTNKLAQPQQTQTANITSKKKKDLLISFGSPERKILSFQFTQTAVQQTEEEKDFLENQAGKIFFTTHTNKQKEKDEIYILNSGMLNTATTNMESETKHTQELSFTNNVEKIFNNQDRTQPCLFLYNNEIYFIKWDKKTEIPTTNKNIKLIFQQDNSIKTLNKNGALTEYQIDENNKTIKETAKQQHFKKGIQRAETLQTPTGALISTQGETANNILYIETKKKQKEQKKTIETVVDSLVFTAGTKNNIQIHLNQELEFVKLEINIKPTNMEFDLDSLRLSWTPTEEEAGYHKATYDIVYNQGGDIEQKNIDGKISIQKTVKKNQQKKNM